MTNPRFNSKANCAKCGNDFDYDIPETKYVVDVMIIGTEVISIGGPSSTQVESMLRTCRRCGYKWLEACADAK